MNLLEIRPQKLHGIAEIHENVVLYIQNYFLTIENFEKQ
jgi:hypothetical protein